MSPRLPKSEILHGTKQFRQVFSRGNKLTGDAITCHYLVKIGKNEGANRVWVGFSVRNKSINAVQRNRVKRLMRESYRDAKAVLRETRTFQGALSIVFSLRQGVATPPPYKKVRMEIESFLQTIMAEKSARV